MGKQPHKTCETCPFTAKVEPGDLGGSPPEVYVGQYFLPFRVPCHECVDYSEEDWKPGALQSSECTGFAMCRNGAGVDEQMPDELLKETYQEGPGVFKDIWGFWSFHNECLRIDALIQLRPAVIMGMCAKEMERKDFAFLSETAGESQQAVKDKLLLQAMPGVLRAWETVMRKALEGAHATV